MVDDVKIKDSKGFDKYLSRAPEKGSGDYLGGANFDARLDQMLFNRMIKLRDLREKPQGNDPGKVYWDGANKKAKIWINETAKWAELVYTSTSTSTTSSSSSSSSTSTS